PLLALELPVLELLLEELAALLVLVPMGPMHACPQAPQSVAALLRFTHEPPQTVSPAGQAHAPLMHLCPAFPSVPQPPQLPSSASVLTQLPLHIVPAQGRSGIFDSMSVLSALTSSRRAPSSWCSASTMWSTMQSTSSVEQRSPEQP